MRKKLPPPPKSNQSRFLPSTLVAYRSGFNTQRTEGIDEALRLIEPAFAGPRKGKTSPDRSVEPGPMEEQLVGDLFLALRYLVERAQASQNDAERKAYERAYCTCIEVVLLQHGIPWPPVFAYDVMSPGSGPEIPVRAFLAAIVAGEPTPEEIAAQESGIQSTPKSAAPSKKLTLREIAEKVPAKFPAYKVKYPPDYDDAAKRVHEDLARTAKPFEPDSRGFGPRNKARTQSNPSASSGTKSTKPRRK